jgi:hypothetical protein
MISVLSDFEKRVDEINVYFSLLENIEEKDAVLYFPYKRTHKYQPHNVELIKILKANLFLLLYNLSESSIKQSLSEIYEQISNEQLKYEEVIDEIKKIWIDEKHNNFKNKGTDNIFKAISNLAEEIIEIQFDSDKVISGNIDGRKIKEFSVKHGFSSSVHKNAKDGVKLHQVKTQRNNLAHGHISFAECGRNYTIGDLREIKHQVILYLRRILKNIEKYLDYKKYAI